MSKSLLSLYVLILISITITYGSDKDSLLNLLEVYQSDTNRVRVLNLLVEATYTVDAKEARGYGEEALSLANELNDLDGKSESLFLLAYTYYFLGMDEKSLQASEECIITCQQNGAKWQEADANYIKGFVLVENGNLEEAEVAYQKCLKIQQDLNYYEGIIRGYKGLGDLAEMEGDYKKALEWYHEGLDIALKHNLKQSIWISYNDLGRIYDQMGNYELGLQSYIQALKEVTEVGNLYGLASLNGNIASIHFMQKNYKKSLEYASESLKINQQISNSKGIASATSTIGNIFFEQGKYEQALEHFTKVMELRKETGDKRGLSYAYFNIGKSYKKKDDLTKAITYHQKSLKLREELGFQMGIVESNLGLGRIHLESKRYRQSLPLLKKALNLAQETGAKKEIRDTYSLLAKYYKATGDFQQAYTYQELFFQVQDSLFNEDRNKQIANMQTLYETEKKDKEILTQQNEILTLEKDKATIAQQRNYFVGGGIFLGILGFLGFRLNRTRKERNDKKALAEALIFAQEEERKRIARDLHDGVGQSLLLLKKQIESSQEVSLENQAMITETLEEVRSISRDLHPFQLEKFGLTAAIHEAILKIENSTDLFITTEIDNIDGFIPLESQIHIFRTIQEALSNIVKHANATAAKVVIQALVKEVKVRIQDNGQGFDYEMAIVTTKSLGLRTMYERIAAIGGKFSISNGETNGTVINFEVPKG